MELKLFCINLKRFIILERAVKETWPVYRVLSIAMTKLDHLLVLAVLFSISSSTLLERDNVMKIKALHRL